MEIGSNFDMDLSNVSCQKYHMKSYLEASREVVFYDSGRSALKALVNHLNKRCVLLPAYICIMVYFTVYGYKINSEPFCVIN